MKKYRFKKGAKNKFIAYAVTFGVAVLTAIILFVFAIPRLTEAMNSYAIQEKAPAQGEYIGEKLEITFAEEELELGSCIVAEVIMQDMNCMKTAFPEGEYSPYLIGDPLVMAEEAGAILAINADNSTYNTGGLVIRGSRFYGYEPWEGDMLLTYHDGSIKCVDASEISSEAMADEMIRTGVTNSFCGGFSLIKDGRVAEKTEDWEKKCAYTCIGMVAEGHYIIVVSNSNAGHTAGMTKAELASLLYKKNCTEAYILESGTECIFIFENQIQNNLCGRKSPREINDIIYFAE